MKSAHGSHLAAALNSVRGVSAEGAVLVLHFGNNEFCRNLCEQQAAVLAGSAAAFLETPSVALDARLGGPAPAQ